MKKLFGILPAVFALLLVTCSFPHSAVAADVRSGDHVIISENQNNLKDLYLFGSEVQVNAPVTNDLVAAGGTITLNGPVTNNVITAGGTTIIRGKVGNTIRAAGGTIVIDGPVTNDLVVAGGNITVSKTASIGGDLLIAGGQLDIEGPVRGKILMSGGNIFLNNTVSGNVTVGRVGTLTLGPQAIINGNLSYSSPNPANLESGSTVLGQTTYHQVEKQQHNKSSGSALYQVLVGIILGILAIYFFRSGIQLVLTRMYEAPFKSLGVGFVYVLLAPLASLILLILFLLGIASFVAYLFILIISMVIADIFVGWWIMMWWKKREKKNYILDWKAGIIGPIVLAVIAWIPIVGWLVAAVIFLITVGAFVSLLVTLMPQLQGTNKK